MGFNSAIKGLIAPHQFAYRPVSLNNNYDFSTRYTLYVIVIPTYSCSRWYGKPVRLIVVGPRCCVCKQPAVLYMSVYKAMGLSATCRTNSRVVLTLKQCEVQCAVYMTGETGPHKASHCMCVTRAASKLEQTFPHLAIFNSTKALLFINWITLPALEIGCSIFFDAWATLREGVWGKEE